ncbi:MAG TPA: DMT family transporter [Rubrobacteraceae bacterium]|nr:DMT family transporter [Rubrobacteraceae bacterium]
MNPALVLAVLAGAAIGIQVVANTIGMKSLGIGGLVGISGLTTGVIGFAVATFATRPEFVGRAVTCAVASGVLGAFIVSAITLAAGQSGLAQTLSLVIASQLLVGLVIDRLGAFGPAAADIGLVKILGVVFILVGGILVVRG